MSVLRPTHIDRDAYKWWISNSENVTHGVVEYCDEEGDQNCQEAESVFFGLLTVCKNVSKAYENSTINLETCADTGKNKQGHVRLKDKAENVSDSHSAAGEYCQFNIGLWWNACLRKEVA